MSPKKERQKGYARETEEWADQWGKCWRCGRQGLWKRGLTIHHFVRGSSRHKNDLRTTIMLCIECHGVEHNSTTDALGLLGCLALKRRFDYVNYDLTGVCRLRGEAKTSITEAEVDAELEGMK